jgi:hypothetical protein
MCVKTPARDSICVKASVRQNACVENCLGVKKLCVKAPACKGSVSTVSGNNVVVMVE